MIRRKELKVNRKIKGKEKREGKGREGIKQKKNAVKKGEIKKE